MFNIEELLEPKKKSSKKSVAFRIDEEVFEEFSKSVKIINLEKQKKDKDSDKLSNAMIVEWLMKKFTKSVNERKN